MTREAVSAPGASAIGPYSHAVWAGKRLYLSGQTPLDPSTGGLVQGDIRKQTEQCFRNLEKTLQAAGATLSDVVKMTVLIRNPADFQKMDDVYKRQFADGYPARITTIVAGFLEPKLLIQIDAVAYKPK